jgi:hypothetical protein
VNASPVLRGLVLAALMLPARAKAPATPEPELVQPGKMLTIKAAPITVPRGATAEAVVTIELLPDYEVLASPPPNPYTTPASLAVESAAGIVARTPVFPPSTTTRDEDGGRPVAVWKGSFEIRVPIVVSGKAEPGERRLKARFRYQAHCRGEYYKVATRAFEIPVTVDTKEEKGKPDDEAGAPATRP